MTSKPKKIEIPADVLAECEALAKPKDLGKKVKGLPMVRLTRPRRTSEIAIAQHLISCIKLHYPIVSTQGSLWLYQKGEHVWKPLDKEKLKGVIDQYDGIPHGKKKEPLSLTSQKTKGIYGAVLRSSEVYDPEFFDDAPIGVQTLSGFVQVGKDGIELFSSHNEHRTRYSVPCEYNPELSLKPWEEFLHRLFHPLPDEAAVTAQVQEFVGAALVGLATQYAKAAILSGAGSNGKSTFIDLISLLFPSYAMTAIVPQLWSQEYYLMRLRGSLLNACNEMPTKDLARSDIFKSVITGDEITARPPYGEPIEFRPIAGHLFSGNEMPGVVDHTLGFWRRFLIVPFSANFSSSRRTKEEVFDEMSEHLPSILLWALQGAHRIQTQGQYTESESADTTLEDWQKSTDPVRTWAEEARVVYHERGTLASKLYANYRNWAGVRGFRILNINTFGRRLASIGFPKKRNKDGNMYQCRPTIACESIIDDGIS